MPRYDYRCPDCGHIEEVTHDFDSVVVVACPVCIVLKENISHLKKVFSPAGLIFKGTGWAGKASKPETTTEKSE